VKKGNKEGKNLVICKGVAFLLGHLELWKVRKVGYGLPSWLQKVQSFWLFQKVALWYFFSNVIGWHPSPHSIGA